MHPLVGHVGDDKTKPSVVVRDKIEEIAANLARRLPEGGKVPTGNPGYLSRNQAGLHIVRELELALQAFAILSGLVEMRVLDGNRGLTRE